MNKILRKNWQKSLIWLLKKRTLKIKLNFNRFWTCVFFSIVYSQWNQISIGTIFFWKGRVQLYQTFLSASKLKNSSTLIRLNVKCLIKLHEFHLLEQLCNTYALQRNLHEICVRLFVWCAKRCRVKTYQTFNFADFAFYTLRPNPN